MPMYAVEQREMAPAELAAAAQDKRKRRSKFGKLVPGIRAIEVTDGESADD